MLLTELKEMAYRGGDFTPAANTWASNTIKFVKDSKDVGDIEAFKVKQKGSILSLWTNNEVIALMRTVIVPNEYVLVDDVWIREDFRGKKVFSKVLWYLRSRENHERILLGKVHSDATYDLIKSGGLSKFKKSWYDLNSGEKIDFDPKTVDDFYKVDKHTWSLMLENNEKEFESMPKFNVPESGFISQTYEWQIK